MTKYYYKIDMRGGSKIMNQKPKTEEEVNKIKDIKKRESWMKLAGKDEDLRSFQIFKRELESTETTGEK